MNNQNKYDNRHNKLRQTEAEFNNMLAYLQEARENSPAFNRRDARDLVNNVFNAMRDATPVSYTHLTLPTMAVV